MVLLHSNSSLSNTIEVKRTELIIIALSNEYPSLNSLSGSTIGLAIASYANHNDLDGLVNFSEILCHIKHISKNSISLHYSIYQLKNSFVKNFQCIRVATGQKAFRFPMIDESCKADFLYI